MNNENETKKSKITMPVRIIAAVLAALMIVGLLAAGISKVDYSADSYEGETENMAEYIQQTDEYMNGDFAYRVYNAVASMGTPQNFDQYYSCASVAIAGNNMEKAEQYLEKCIETYSGDDSYLGYLYIKLGCVLAMNGKWEQAQEKLAKGVELAPDNSDGWLLLFQAASQNGDYEQALSAISNYPPNEELSADIYPLIVTTQLMGGEYDAALESCDEALKKEDCDKAQMYFLRCKTDFYREDYPQCREDALAAKDAGYDYQEAMTMVAAAYEGEKDYVSVLEILMEIIGNGTEDESVYKNALACALEVNDYTAQKTLINWYLQQEHDDEEELSLRSQLAMAQLQSGEYDEAEENLNFCLNAQPENNQLKYLRGVCLMNKAQYYKAVNDFTEVMKAGELVDECHYNRAVCFIALGYGNDADTELREIISRNETPKMVTMAQQLLDSRKK